MRLILHRGGGETERERVRSSRRVKNRVEERERGELLTSDKNGLLIDHFVVFKSSNGRDLLLEREGEQLEEGKRTARVREKRLHNEEVAGRRCFPVFSLQLS